MYRNFVSALYVLNIVIQSIITLVTPAALGFLIALLAVRGGAPGWLYALLIPIGAVAGFVSMIKFAIRASEALNQLEKQRQDKDKK